MSDYVFRWRNEMRPADWNLTYYATNPYSNTAGRERESYAWGRFWEIIDYYVRDPSNTEPTNLGYVQRTSLGQTDYFYAGGVFWFHAFDHDTQDTYYVNTDNYLRILNVVPAGRALGGVVIFENNRIGVIEKIYGAGDFIVSYYGFDPDLQSPSGFYTQRVINSQFRETNSVYNLVGIVGNPIFQMYDNIIQGKPIYYKLPFWMYRRILLQRRGELL